MSFKLEVIEVIVFAKDDFIFPPLAQGFHPMESKGRQKKAFLPIHAISHLTEVEFGNPRAGYHVHLKKDWLNSFSFPVKSINSARLTHEQVELINKNSN